MRDVFFDRLLDSVTCFIIPLERLETVKSALKETMAKR